MEGADSVRPHRWQPTPVFLPGKSCGRRSLVDYSPWGWEEWDRAETARPSLCPGGPGVGAPATSILQVYKEHSCP